MIKSHSTTYKMPPVLYIAMYNNFYFCYEVSKVYNVFNVSAFRLLLFFSGLFNFAEYYIVFFFLQCFFSFLPESIRVFVLSQLSSPWIGMVFFALSGSMIFLTLLFLLGHCNFDDFTLNLFLVGAFI